MCGEQKLPACAHRVLLYSHILHWHSCIDVSVSFIGCLCRGAEDNAVRVLPLDSDGHGAFVESILFVVCDFSNDTTVPFDWFFSIA